MITQYPLLSAILLLMVGSFWLTFGLRLICRVEYPERGGDLICNLLITFAGLLIMFGSLAWFWGLNILDGQMLAMHSLHSIELFLSVILFSTGVPLLFRLKFDPLFYQRASSPYHVWEAFHQTVFSTVGFALVIISALIVSP